jgi:hypothetical protein
MFSNARRGRKIFSARELLGLGGFKCTKELFINNLVVDSILVGIDLRGNGLRDTDLRGISLEDTRLVDNITALVASVVVLVPFVVAFVAVPSIFYVSLREVVAKNLHQVDHVLAEYLEDCTLVIETTASFQA